MTQPQDASLIGLAVFAGWYSLLAMSPGPNFLIVMQAGLGQPRRAGLSAAIGVAIGAALLAAGVSAFSGSIGNGGPAQQLVAAGFCALLLITGFRLALRSVTPVPQPGASCPPRQRSHFWLGFCTAIANPVSAGFFALQTARPEAALPAAPMAMIVFAVALSWFGLVALTVATPGAQKLYQRWQRPLLAIAGFLLIHLSLAAMPGLASP